MWVKWITAVCLGAAIVSAQAEAPASAQVCVACHGAAGVASAPMYPNLAGQHETYLVNALNAYRKGDRQNALMASITPMLTDADVVALAAYFAAKPLSIAANGNPNLVSKGEYAAGYCMGCHGHAGVPVANEFPIIAGQNADYIAAALTAYREGDREHPLMSVVARRLDDDTIAALAAFYSQVDPKDYYDASR